MARIPRWIPDDSLVEISCRCIQGRYLLRPSKELNLLILGVLGRALSLFPVELHGAVFLSNHYHLLGTFPSTGVMAKFMGYLNRNLSIEIGKLYKWRGPMWEGRYHHSIVDDDPSIQIERLRYLLSQGVKEGLVLTPADWPGVHCAEALKQGHTLHGLWVDRTAIWVAKNQGMPFNPEQHTSETTVEFHPLPCWRQLAPAVQRQRVVDLVDDIVHHAKQNHARLKTQPAGARVINSYSPHFRPERVKWSPAPRVFASTKKARWALWRAVQAVVVAYGHAVERLAEGANNVTFPEGTFPPRKAYIPSRADIRLGFA